MIHIIEYIQLKPFGPWANFGAQSQEVFLNQGSIDGACGPYSLIMGLLSLGVVDRNVVVSYYTDKRTNFGKLVMAMNEEHSTLFTEGTDLGDLQYLLKESFGKKINAEISEHKGTKLIDFALEKLSENKPTIIGVNFKDGAHWMLAIGYENDSNGFATKLLLLNPSGKSPIFSSWNAVIDLVPNKSGRYPYNWWGNCQVQFDQALVLCLK